jgi:peptidoglycan hydrolase CwlO-like protein
MKRFLLVVLLLVVAIGALGYWRGWFTVSKEGKTDVQVDSAKFNQDKKALSKSVGEKAKALKNDVARLWKKTESLTGDEKTQAQKELGELQKKHDRLEQQIKELEDAGQDRFEGIKKDLEATLEDVDNKIKELAKKLEKEKDK